MPTSPPAARARSGASARTTAAAWSVEAVVVTLAYALGAGVVGEVEGGAVEGVHGHDREAPGGSVEGDSDPQTMVPRLLEMSAAGVTDVLVIAGLSGAGRSQAADDLEDLGTYYEGAKLTFAVPDYVDIDSIEDLKEEWFGPLLHVTTWKSGELVETIRRINATGFGLTMGLHSRIARAAETVEEVATAGNLYVNRSMIGAIVGSQPFGGEGLSGTGPKAGGPHYLPRFCTERVTSTDTTSSGGNATLLSLEDVGI